MSAATVLLADDHSAIRGGLRMILESIGGFTVVGEAADGAGAVRMARALRPDVVLMDLRMPGMDGIAATAEITGEGLAAVLVLTTFDIDEYVFAALRAGAAGFLLKSVEPAELVRAVQSVADGDSVLSPEVTGRLISAFVQSPAAAPAAATGAGAGAGTGTMPAESLTAREEAVLACIGEGLSNQQISRRLGIAETTVKTHVSRVLAKLGVSSRVQAAIAFRGRG
ncbi:response regulator [Arthrobacter sp. zg-Y895]|uniref:response regulator n=1 Tax=Arthrobacter sp. zg-Y895 TaxID=2886933 RepID=UPI001D155BF6|nr:response regulator transcription factor [Arthrobacter sp. zg-Y895]MCC3301291.1 response regulator transcription factor [Arthrobacter sp. zg-Y895]MCC3302538.1 response regulator transcription factor [Arthrobacter sp. zg-Y895]